MSTEPIRHITYGLRFEKFINANDVNEDNGIDKNRTELMNPPFWMPNILHAAAGNMEKLEPRHRYDAATQAM